MTTQNSFLCTIEGEGSGREELHEEVEAAGGERLYTERLPIYSDV